MKTNTKKPKRGGFLTRTQAVRYLQVTLADFRRLCILKGIFPRDVSGKSKQKLLKGSTKPVTAYYRKDIQYLMHEPLLQKFRDHKVFAKKLSKALGRGDVSDARRLDENRPRYTLDHIIKERYPTFSDALGDLDDALSTLFLFAIMPASDKVSYRITQEASRLTNEWMAFVAREKLLKKVFVSIKGVYYQANIKGQDILWLVPFKFPQNVPSDVDFKIMLTFLEFYSTLLHFVCYRLYTEEGLVYPPPIDKLREKGVGGIGTYILESQAPTQALPSVELSGKKTKKARKVAISVEKARAADKGDGEEQESESEDEAGEGDAEGALDEFDVDAESGDKLLQPVTRDAEALFSKFTFFVGREVPLDIVEFVILANGGKVISESALDELVDNEDETKNNNTDADAARAKLDIASVTHQICDRPTISRKVPGRVYVQPQWLFDSVNKNELVPVNQYVPGETLPPHLSPWGDRGTYDPEAKETPAEGEDEDEDEDDEEVVKEAVEVDNEQDEGSDEEAQKELQMEAQGVVYSEAPKPAKKSKKRKTESGSADKEEKELRKLMMSNKQKKLYERMQHGNDKKQARDDALRKKKRKIEKLKTKGQ